MQLMVHYSAENQTPEKLAAARYTFASHYFKDFRPAEDYNDWTKFANGMIRILESCSDPDHTPKIDILKKVFRPFAFTGNVYLATPDGTYFANLRDEVLKLDFDGSQREIEQSEIAKLVRHTAGLQERMLELDDKFEELTFTGKEDVDLWWDQSTGKPKPIRRRPLSSTELRRIAFSSFRALLGAYWRELSKVLLSSRRED